MKLEPGLKLKWLDPSLPAAAGLQFKVTNHCALWISNQVDGPALGLCVFDPRDLNSNLLLKFRNRFERMSPKPSVHLQVPAFIEHRLSSLSTETSAMEIQTRISPFLCVQHQNGVFSVRSHLTVVNVDDSAVILRLLKHLLSEVPYVKLVDQISDSAEASKKILRLDPDAVTMDIQMPGKTGVEVVREIIRERYIPTIMVSSVSTEEGTLVFSALREGAFEYLQKPKAEDKGIFLEALVEKLLAGVSSSKPRLSLATPSKASSQIQFDKSTIWCLGASTGGTQALTEVFRGLPARIPPLLVVQHIPPIFSKSFADSVNELVPFRVKEAEDRELIREDTVYVAPGGTQMAVTESPQGLQIVISDAPPVNRFKPSVDFLFESISKLKGRKIVGGVLTGMGKDGAEGLLRLKKAGAYTFAQDEATSTVYGMPRAAYELGATQDVFPLGQVADGLMGSSKHFRKAS